MWWIVIERNSWPHAVPMIPLVYGPWDDVDQAKVEMIRDDDIVYALLTIDAKAENYTVLEVYMTDEPPDRREEIPSCVDDAGDTA